VVVRQPRVRDRDPARVRFTPAILAHYAISVLLKGALDELAEGGWLQQAFEGRGGNQALQARHGRHAEVTR